MSIAKTCICTRSTLLANGLAHFIRSYAPEYSIDFISSLNELLTNQKLQYAKLFLDTRLLAAGQTVSLEKLSKNLPGAQIIALNESALPDRLVPFFDHEILIDGREEDIHELFEKIFQPTYTNGNKTGNTHVISDREREILKYVALGYTNKEISDRLSISTHTVITHRKNITFKLGIKTISGLTVFAILNNIISAEEVNS